MVIGAAIEKMIDFYGGDLHNVNHSLKVYAFAKAIGASERLDAETQQVLEFAAIAHDIARPLCQKKYGNTDAKHQEEEGIPLARQFMAELSAPDPVAERVAWLVGHHHTYDDVRDIDHQILLEADFLVNADEAAMPEAAIRAALERVFK
ncbi:MAG: HD domain-containing protein, partial [Christensenellaceae bacterium]|nr:HD domain-containing protein [Christensenellaceae bacterium]